MNYKQVLDFWFDPENKEFWFSKSDEFDLELEEKFGHTLQQAMQCELWTWRETAEGRLAEIIVLDQFSRNLFRDHPASFAQDPLALSLAQEAVRLGLDQQLAPDQRCFMYMPFMHSESKIIHAQALQLFEALGNPINLGFELKHKTIIDRFGRYPHRNQILERESTPEEVEFLTQPNSSF
ncbi:MAG: DUF924 domain-containing protein [Acinetobacter sp.]|nr:DUF924 domain-containing protein [Acinetobacter sp.]MBP8207787.1 DUF924 domain-containing protein [Acinetobacter sp.]